MAGSSYGELVRRHRVAAGLTQEELAARSGLGVRTVSDIERGRIGRPHRSTVDLIARTLDRDDLAYDDLAAQLERLIGPRSVHQRALGEAAIVRTYPPAASWMLAPADTVRYLEDVLADLSPDERSHFVAKAQGAEQGELSWFFEGREMELARISAWLRQVSSGMLVVTGRAGSGKSALLGTGQCGNDAGRR